ncbi:hypothetical protein L6452_03295 [Arctium lappa]|uniref:Uncharacterized protein n=1 Tax=Arctium lappa TaxID=4217 RepID=A0ACB9FMU5_ARCLA|nr:hypothetical protein L6452_03295 [Arctium lappa]
MSLFDITLSSEPTPTAPRLSEKILAPSTYHAPSNTLQQRSDPHPKPRTVPPSNQTLTATRTYCGNRLKLCVEVYRQRLSSLPTTNYRLKLESISYCAKDTQTPGHAGGRGQYDSNQLLSIRIPNPYSPNAIDLPVLT